MVIILGTYFCIYNMQIHPRNDNTADRVLDYSYALIILYINPALEFISVYKYTGCKQNVGTDVKYN